MVELEPVRRGVPGSRMRRQQACALHYRLPDLVLRWKRGVTGMAPGDGAPASPGRTVEARLKALARTGGPLA